VEDHSRNLKHLRAVAPAEVNTPESRRSALEAHALWLEGAVLEAGTTCGIRFAPAAPYRLELTVTDLGEVRTKYIVYGIASGVAWGVATGLVAHNPKLAVGLGGYELLEETAFWIGGSTLFSAWSAPVVVEARLTKDSEPKPLWTETYYALSGSLWLKGLPPEVRTSRGTQLRASMQKIVSKVFQDLEDIPGFPKGTEEHLAAPAASRAIQERILAPAIP